MPLPARVYPLLVAWLQAMGVAPHEAARSALAGLVLAVLTAQTLRAADLMRTLLSPEAVPARQRYKRLARHWDRPWLTSAGLTPGLVRAATALVAPDPAGSLTAGLTHLALDSVRLGRWEAFVLGVVWHGRVLPVGWAVLPYPLPKGAFTPTTCGLIARVAAAWPVDRPARLSADRAFPSYALLGALAAAGWGYYIRLQARHWVTVGGVRQQARALLADAAAVCWTTYAGAYGAGARAIPGTILVGRGLVVLPAHQRAAGSRRHRAAQAARRLVHLQSKHPGQATDSDAWVILFSSDTDPLVAQAGYTRRWAVEGSFRDAQGGWDSQHGWNLEPVAARLTEAAKVDRLLGLWALAALVQSWVGHAAGQAAAPAEVQAVRREWTTSGRLSVWARGRLVFTDRSGRLDDWLTEALDDGARRLASALPPPADLIPFPARRRSITPSKAA